MPKAPDPPWKAGRLPEGDKPEVPAQGPKMTAKTLKEIGASVSGQISKVLNVIKYRFLIVSSLEKKAVKFFVVWTEGVET